MIKRRAVYLDAYDSGKLDRSINEAYNLITSCSLCPRNCEIDRTAGETGICKTGSEARVCSFSPHYGEETPISGIRGSGTIFFSYCNLYCCFCQNYEISFKGEGDLVTDKELAGIMLHLQERGCHNINLVTPTHVLPFILSALKTAISCGLSIPLVYNSSSYDRVVSLKLLDGIIDIYLPDFKFWNPEIAKRACLVKDYPKRARHALIEMHRQVGDLKMDASGIAERGVLLRHLVMPDKIAGTRHIMKFVAEQISPDMYVNIMSQYRPCGEAYRIDELSRPLDAKEYHQAVQSARDVGIINFI